jgi:hypothetical protein
MTEVLVYCSKDPRPAMGESQLRWHSSHLVLGGLVPGDRLWVVTSGKALGRPDPSAGYLLGVWSVASVIENPGDDPEHPAPKYRHRLLVNETEAIHLDEAICVDHLIRGEGYDAEIPVGRFLRGPRRLTDEKVRQLRAAAGADLARKWLTASKPTSGDIPAAVNVKKKGRNMP